MLLQNLIAAEEPLRVQAHGGAVFDLPGAATFKNAIIDAPVRYVLDDSAAALVTHTAFSESNLVDTSLDLLRVPSTAFWVEWCDKGRDRVISELGVVDPMAIGAKRGRAGALVTADSSAKRGEIRVFWENDTGGADLSPFYIEFDFDDKDFNDASDRSELARFVSLPGVDILDALYARTRFCLQGPWHDFYRHSATSDRAFNEVVEANVAMIAAEMPFVAAFCLILSARGAFRYSSSALKKINTAREKRGHRPLLEHVTVRLDLGPHDEVHAASQLHHRTGPRLHHVCGHLVRRSGALHWRRAHMRGDPSVGLISSRTVNVTTSRMPVKRFAAE